jgi:hypothetical protein
MLIYLENLYLTVLPVCFEAVNALLRHSSNRDYLLGALIFSKFLCGVTPTYPIIGIPAYEPDEPDEADCTDQPDQPDEITTPFHGIMILHMRRGRPLRVIPEVANDDSEEAPANADSDANDSLIEELIAEVEEANKRAAEARARAEAKDRAEVSEQLRGSGEIRTKPFGEVPAT